MNRELAWMGLLAMLLIVVVTGFNLIREENRQAEALIDLRVEAVTEGIDRYANNCAICHGADGQGLGATPPLNVEGIREMDYTALFRTIERGRYNTLMAAYSVEEGGIFTGTQIDTLVAVIQYANWNAVETRVAELGLTPPDPIVVELSDETLADVAALPDGEALSAGLQTYVTECAACHGASGEGSSLAPALNDADLRTTQTDADLVRTISNGVPGTLMAGWNGALTESEIADVTLLLRRWPEIEAAGIDMPVIEVEPIAITPELIAQGEWLYGLACSQCHGSTGYGTPLAPALNNLTFLSETPDAAIQQIISLGVPGTNMPAWGGRLLDTDIQALTAYLRSLEPTAPAVAQSTTTGTTPQTGTGAGTGGGPPWKR